jgi:hypothetical protein
MPYYVFALKPFAQLDKLAEFAAFKDASTHAKALRVEPTLDSKVRIKVMFAHDSIAAEELLLQVREAGPSGDD